MRRAARYSACPCRLSLVGSRGEFLRAKPRSVDRTFDRSRSLVRWSNRGFLRRLSPTPATLSANRPGRQPGVEARTSGAAPRRGDGDAQARPIAQAGLVGDAVSRGAGLRSPAIVRRFVGARCIREQPGTWPATEITGRWSARLRGTIVAVRDLTPPSGRGGSCIQICEPHERC